MDKFLIRAFESYLDMFYIGDNFTAYDFIEYVKNRYPKKTPTVGAASHLCRRSTRCCYDDDKHCYMVIT